ncbi:MAG TPA: hypothetical protein VL137_00745, partial [Polyangiaceae bacterium]|nr:hypothetical protein [Polyangiaceae bacterium]
GWRDWLRPAALKMFVGITDDSPGTNAGGTNQRCTTASGLTNDQMGAQAFDQALRSLDPAQFGAYDAQDPDANRNYRWYSIVGLTSKAAPDERVAYQPAEPIVTTVCTGANAGSTDDDGQSAGQGYQYLSQMTGGLRYSSCLNDDFDAIFNAIAQGVVEGAKLNCDFNIPQVNGEINFDNVRVNYLEGGADAGMPHSLVRVPSATDCNADNQYYLGTQYDGGTGGDAGGAAYNHVFLCSDACTAVQADPKAQMQIDFGCLGQ